MKIVDTRLVKMEVLELDDGTKIRRILPERTYEIEVYKGEWKQIEKHCWPMYECMYRQFQDDINDLRHS